MKKFRKKITLQFTILVIALILINGIFILSFDYFISVSNDKESVVEKYNDVIEDFEESRKTVKEHFKYISNINIFDTNKNNIYSGFFFKSLEETVPLKIGFSSIVIQEKPDPEDEKVSVDLDKEIYTIYTDKLTTQKFDGYIQIALESEVEIDRITDLIYIFLIQSILIGILVYLFGRFFAKKSLKPAEIMFKKLEQFTHDASHQLKTPLAIINASLDVGLKTKKYEENILDAKNEVKNATELINKLLALTKVDKYQFAKTDINISEILNETISKQTKTIPEKLNIKIELYIQKNIIVSGDNDLFKQIVVNLFENAIKFNKENGYIKILLNESSLIIENSCKENNGDFSIKMFERFARSDENSSVEGYGIGLAIVKRIIELHDFQIETQILTENVVQIKITF